MPTMGGLRAADVGNGNQLIFPSNVSGSDTSAPFVALQFASPQNNGLIFKNGMTFIWEYRPTQQTGYYDTWWYSASNGTFPLGDTFPYVGGHPYPQSQTNAGTVHDWEIAGMEPGGDARVTRSGATKQVVQDTNYLQAMRITRNGDSTKTAVFYIALPSTANADVIEKSSSSTFGESIDGSTAYALTIGDSPWYAGNQHERLSGRLGRIKIFNIGLTEADMLLESANLAQIVTAAGSGSIWYGKNGYESVDDLTCDFGTGRAPVWASATKATLYTP